MNFKLSIQLLLLLGVSISSYSMEPKRPTPTISCTHAQVCNSIRLLLGESSTSYNVKNLITTKGQDPHHFDPSIKDLKSLYNAKILVLPPLGLQPWLRQVQRNRQQDKKKITFTIKQKKLNQNEHFWLNDSSLCDVLNDLKKKLLQKLKIKSSYRLRDHWVCQNQTIKELRLKFKNKKVIILHNALTDYLKRLGIQAYSVRGKGHLEKATPKSLKLIHKLLNSSQDIIWIIEKQIHIPRKIQSLIHKKHLKININSYGKDGEKPQEVLKRLNKKLEAI